MFGQDNHMNLQSYVTALSQFNVNIEGWKWFSLCETYFNVMYFRNLKLSGLDITSLLVRWFLKK